MDRRVSSEERRLIIKELLERTGLLSASHTRIGNGDDEKVLSGGERKRLAFAVELLNNPVILFCDEPTTGLDSYSAQQLVATLHELAQKGTTILCTIHQVITGQHQLYSLLPYSLPVSIAAQLSAL